MSRSLRTLFELRAASTPRPAAAFTLPIRPLSTTTPTKSATATTPVISAESHQPKAAAATAAAAGAETQALYPRIPQQVSPPTSETRASLAQLLPLLRAQPAHYLTAHIWGRPYLVTAGDQIRLPFKMPGVVPGDVLRLDRASTLGSRDFTLQGKPYIDERLFECRATVLGTETEPLRVKVKTKRRQRRAKQVKSKHHFTMLRISEVNIHGPEAVGL
ncbi:mitochondrial 54S ribosomal protein bL21m [Apiospora kogelbergensis]|uniref:Large ribosomal subunit protein bL21m n=1 Tax=Apiospora kogelbergensis TaxID=1337665 RepID=A0AAW0QW84_9PEZI